MSFNYFCHNISLKGGGETCIEWTPSVSTAQMVALRSEVRGSDFNSVVSTHAGLNGVIAVKGDLLFHNSPNTNSILSSGQLYFSDDFGATWSTVTKPVDTVYQTVNPGGFASAYPNSFGWGPSFRVIGDKIHAMLRAGESMSLWNTADGSSWSMVTSTVVAAPSILSPYSGSYLKVGSGTYQIGEISGSPYLFGKWAASTTARYSTLQIGGWSFDENPDEWYNTLDNNIINIGDTGYGSVAIGRMVYQWASAPGGRLQLIDLDTYAGARKVSSASWNGSSWTYTTTGAWLESNGLNSPFAVLSPAADAYQYSGDKVVASIPLTGNATSSSANWGKWYIFTGMSVQTVDFSSVMTREPVEESTSGTGICGALRYIPEIGAWILTWAYPRVSGKTAALSMRMCTRVGDTWNWSAKVRYLLPAPFTSISSSRCQIEYSASQNKFVFGGQFSTPSPYLTAASFENVFVCSAYGAA